MHSVANLATLQTPLAIFFPSKKRPNLVSENHRYSRARSCSPSAHTHLSLSLSLSLRLLSFSPSARTHLSLSLSASAQFLSQRAHTPLSLSLRLLSFSPSARTHLSLSLSLSLRPFNFSSASQRSAERSSALIQLNTDQSRRQGTSIRGAF